MRRSTGKREVPPRAAGSRAADDAAHRQHKVLLSLTFDEHAALIALAAEREEKVAVVARKLMMQAMHSTASG